MFYDGRQRLLQNQLFDSSQNNFTHTVGAGFRYQTPVGPVAIDIGRRLRMCRE